MNAAMRIIVAGTGSCLPDRVMSNDDLSLIVDTSDEWIRTRTGIRDRRICAPDETTASLGVQAARRALDAAKLTPQDVELIVCATITPDTLCPSAACMIQAGLGCRTVPAFDLNAACSGFIYALAVANGLMRAQGLKHVLVVGSENMSRVVDYSDRNTCILFGDGAGAVVLSTANADDPRGIKSIRLGADGRGGRLIQLNGTRTRPPAGSAATPRQTDVFDYLRMNGREVFKFAVLRMGALVQDALRENNLTVDDVGLIVPHQVNQRVIDAALDDLKFPAERVLVNIDRYGNTSAASVPIALDEAIRGGRAKAGDTILLIAFGGGLTWASALITL